MFEKVNPSHPDKLADRIAGAIVDLAYAQVENPKIAVEVLLGHGYAYVIIESSVSIKHEDVGDICRRIAGIHPQRCRCLLVPQDQHLADNQGEEPRCGDNGIFKGSYITDEQNELTAFARRLYDAFPSDGKMILDSAWLLKEEQKRLIVCQSNATQDQIYQVIAAHCAANPHSIMGQIRLDRITINPLGEWTGGPYVDSGATNRKLGSDMGDGMTGGGLHGKDLTKADVSVNIVAHQLSQRISKDVYATCAIGDTYVDFYNDCMVRIKRMPYADVIKQAHAYILGLGGFEKFAEWGLVR